MKFLAEHFVKIGVVALLVVGILIRDDLFPSDDHAAKAPPVSPDPVSLEPASHDVSPAVGDVSDETLASTSIPSAEPGATFSERREATNQDAEAWRGVVDDLAKAEPASQPEAVEPEVAAVEPEVADESAATEASAEGSTEASASEQAAETEQPVSAPTQADAQQAKTMAWGSEETADSVVEPEQGAGDSALAAHEAEGIAPSVEEAEQGADDSASNGGGSADTEVAEANDGSAEGAGAEAPAEVSAETASSEQAEGEAGAESEAPALGLNDARKAFHEGRVDDAIALYHAVLDGEPGNYLAAGELGNVYMGQNEWDLATDAYALAAEILFQQDNWPGTLSMLSLIGNLAPKRAIEMSTDFSERRAERFRAASSESSAGQAASADESESQTGDVQ